MTPEEQYMEALHKFARGEIPFEQVQQVDPTRQATLDTAAKAAQVRLRRIRQGHPSAPGDVTQTRH